MAGDSLVGRSARLTFTVGPPDLAIALHSGDVPVLATPRMIAWMEAATVAAVADFLPPGATSVGTTIEVKHLAASPVGTVVAVMATVRSAEGKSLVFDCAAEAAVVAGDSTLIGRGAITRAVVDRERFIARLTAH